MTDTSTPSVPLADWLKEREGIQGDLGNHALAKRYRKSAALLRQQHAALVAWEAWEAEWIVNGNWDHGNVLLRDEDMEALTPLQEKRTAALQLAFQNKGESDE